MMANENLELYASRTGVYAAREMIELVENLECTCPEDCEMLWISARWPDPNPQHDLDDSTNFEEESTLEVSAAY